MRHWSIPFFVGLVIGCALVAAAWLAPAFLPPSLAESTLQPAYRMEELVARFVPEVTAAMQRALASSASMALGGYVLVSMVHLFARPTGPGEASKGWRTALWCVVLLGVAVLAASTAYYFLAFGVTTTDDAIVTQWSAYLGVAAAFVFWILSIVGAERMLRPAVPLATWVLPA